MIFLVDLLDIYLLSLLGQEALTAAIGFAGTLMFFLTSTSIALQIAMGALVSRAEGRHQRQLAGRYCTNVLWLNGIFSVLISIPIVIYTPELLMLLGAQGEALRLAAAYCYILVPSTVILSLGISAMSAVRALGDARYAMYSTLGAGLVNAIFDPIFIFGLDWGIEGSALASLMARIALIGIAFYAMFIRHKLPVKTTLNELQADLLPIVKTAGPALITNLATPLGSSFVMITMAQFGNSAVAGAAIIGRIVPVAFSAVFALSGAIGPIIGQNAGAQRYDRVRETLLNAVICIVIYVLGIWVLMILLNDFIIDAFKAQAEAAALLSFYNHWLIGAFIFNGILFIANASFNNLNRAYLATLFNLGRALAGTIPFVYIGAKWYGPVGVLAGELAGALAFGFMALATVLWHIKKLDTDSKHKPLIDDSLPASKTLS